MHNKPFSPGDHVRFILPSVLGILLFMTPIKVDAGMTIPIAILADWIQEKLAEQLSVIMMLIIVVTAIMTVIVKMVGSERLDKTPFFQQLFHVSLFWTIIRVIAAAFAIMVVFKLGPEMIYDEATGGMLIGDDGLLHTLFAVFLFAGLFLPLLMNFGLLEFFGTLMTPIMRPLFKLPGRASIDSLASWVGDGTIGVLLTSKQYEEGYYSKREAIVIGSTFSVVSITFTLVVIAEVGLANIFVPFYLTVLLAGFVAALIMPRIPPLSLKKDSYIGAHANKPDESIPEGDNVFNLGYRKALKKSQGGKSLYTFFKEGAQNVLDMWMGVAPVVMAFGLIALILAEYTPLFTWLGMPFVPLLEMMQVPYAAEASETILVGFTDMFMPAIIGKAIASEMTRFIIAALSITQLIYMSEVGGLLLGSKIPVSFLDLVIIFLERTLITLPIIVLCAHIIF